MSSWPSQTKDFPRKSRPQGEKLLLDNRKCRFDPHVAVLTSGSTVEAINSDAFFHTTHLYSGPSSRNLSLHVGGKASHSLQRPGFVIVKCDVHGWMKAFIRVDNHPFHAVSGRRWKVPNPGHSRRFLYFGSVA